MAIGVTIKKKFVMMYLFDSVFSELKVDTADVYPTHEGQSLLLLYRILQRRHFLLLMGDRLIGQKGMGKKNGVIKFLHELKA